MIWEPQYSVKLGELDAQHRYFVTLLEGIEEISSLRQTSQLTPILEELLRYARYHFTTEEALMDAYGYDGAVHRAAHAKLLNRIESMLLEVDFRPAKLRLFVYNWLVVHIQLEDAALADYVIERRALVLAAASIGTGCVG